MVASGTGLPSHGLPRPREAIRRDRSGRVVAPAGLAATWAAWKVRHAASPAVRAWQPGAGNRRGAGPLSVRVLGEGPSAVVLLHGLTGSGDGFGAGFDVLSDRGRLVVPDLLGFGRSMDLERSDFGLQAHLDALDAMVAELSVAGLPLTVAGHSMGAVLALHWAARRPETRRVVLFCAPLYEDTAEAKGRMRHMGLVERFFALESPLSAFACALMCRYRGIAQWLAVASSPQWPVHLARMGVLHSWSSYLGGMNGIVQGPGWREAMAELNARRVPMVLAEGAHDRVPVPGCATALAERFECAAVLVHPTAGHDLPVSYPNWCAELILAR